MAHTPQTELTATVLELITFIQAVNAWQSTSFTFFRFIFLTAGRQVGTVRKLTLTVHCTRQGTGAMLEALQQ